MSGLVTLLGLPMAGHRVLDTRDLDEARESIGHESCPHRLRILGDTRPFRARLHVARLGTVRVQYLAYGARVRLDHEHAQDTYILVLPLSGTTDISDGHDRVAAAGSLAAFLSPGTHLVKDLSAGSHRVLVRVDGTMLEATLSRLLGRPTREPLRFDLRADMANARGQGFKRFLDLVRADIEHDTRLLTHPLAVRTLEQLLMTELLLTLRHSHSELLHSPERSAPPAYVHRATELLQQQAAEPLTVEDVAAAVGIGARSLQQGFRQHLRTTPTAYLRDIRLARAHAELLAATADDAVSVTEIALRWGFLHPSRFAQIYRQAYGQTPSTTLRSQTP